MRIIRQNETLADQAFTLLKEDIATGKLKVGQALPEEQLAKDLGISRTPLRDAMGRLVMEGLLIHETGKPAIVAGFTKEDAMNQMEMRRILEVENIQKIIPEAQPGFLESLEKNLKEQQSSLEEGNYQNFLELDRSFHLLLTEPNDNPEFKKMIQKMHSGVNRSFLTLSSTIRPSARETLEEHIDIVQAIKQNDSTAAGDRMKMHINNVGQRFLEYYDEN